MFSRAMRATGRHMMKSTSVSGEIYGMEHADGSQSDTALGSLGRGIKKRRSSLSQRVVAILPSRRSRSTSQLSQTGEGGDGIKSEEFTRHFVGRFAGQAQKFDVTSLRQRA